MGKFMLGMIVGICIGGIIAFLLLTLLMIGRNNNSENSASTIIKREPGTEDHNSSDKANEVG